MKYLIIKKEKRISSTNTLIVNSGFSFCCLSHRFVPVVAAAGARN